MKNRNINNIIKLNSGITVIAILIIIIVILLIIFTIRIMLDNKNKELGNKTNEKIEQSNIDESNTIEDDIPFEFKYVDISDLKSGDYIIYDTGRRGEIVCRVLYPSLSPYGLQIIADKSVRQITLGGTDLESAQQSYNNAISLLNTEAERYLNNSYASSARCVGSNPNDKNNEEIGPIELNYSYKGSKNFNAKKQDENYKIDLEAMEEAGITGIEEDYWMASRNVVQDKSGTFLRIYGVYGRGVLSSSGIIDIWGNENSEFYSKTCGLRPCFTLKATSLKIIDGNGTNKHPYVLATK